MWTYLGSPNPYHGASAAVTNNKPRAATQPLAPVAPKAAEPTAPVVKDPLKPMVQSLRPSSSNGGVAVFGDEALEVTIISPGGDVVLQQTKSGISNITWSGKDGSGRAVEPGTYLCKIKGVLGQKAYYMIAVVK